MRKKIILFIGIIIILISLFTSTKLSDKSEKISFVITNAEALAEQENSGQHIECIESGYVCIGIDKNGVHGKHLGLTRTEK